MEKKLKLLIVEDETVQSMHMEILLQAWGHETCKTVVSGLEAIETAERERPDVVLMDVNIQGEVDGISAAGSIIGGLGIPVILLTGYDDASVYQRAMSVNPAGYFVKPYDFDDLRVTLETLS